MKITLEFKLQDFWIGAFWKRTVTEQVCHCGDYMKGHSAYCGHSPVEMTAPDLLDIWVCFVPCFPIHISLEVNPIGH